VFTLKGDAIQIIERTMQIAKELSDLIVYCRPVTFDSEKGEY